MAALLALTLAPTACAVDRSPDLAAYRASVVAHELGHAGGLDHVPHGLMAAYWEGNELPAADDWTHGDHAWETGCRNWGVEPGLEDAFDTAAEAWCAASSGEWCPWRYDHADDGCCWVRWSGLDDGTLGRWTPGLIRINTVLK